MNKERLHEFVENSTGNEKNICQIYALKNGQCVYEDCWHGFKTDDAMHIASVTKGVVSLLTGIAIDRGYIKSVDQKVMNFFPTHGRCLTRPPCLKNILKGNLKLHLFFL